MAYIAETKGRRPTPPRVSHAAAVAQSQLTKEQMDEMGWVGSPGFMGRGAMRVARSAPGYTSRQAVEALDVIVHVDNVVSLVDYRRTRS